jgi:hypothetical protein
VTPVGGEVRNEAHFRAVSSGSFFGDFADH